MRKQRSGGHSTRGRLIISVRLVAKTPLTEILKSILVKGRDTTTLIIKVSSIIYGHYEITKQGYLA